MTKTGENNNNNDDNGSKDDYAGDNNNNDDDCIAVECHSGTCVGDGCRKSAQNIFSRHDHG
jgi:hypothetical protein